MSNFEYIDLSKDDTIDQLQQENKQLKKENQLLRKTLNNLKGDKASDTLVNAVNAVYEPLLKDKFDDIERLKKQLADLQSNHDIMSETYTAEIERLQDKLKRTEKAMHKEVKEHLNTIVDLNQLRHEICEKIRDECVYVAGTKRLCENTSISTYNLNEILNQIEQGEKK